MGVMVRACARVGVMVRAGAVTWASGSGQVRSRGCQAQGMCSRVCQVQGRYGHVGVRVRAGIYHVGDRIRADAVMLASGHLRYGRQCEKVSFGWQGQVRSVTVRGSVRARRNRRGG